MSGASWYRKILESWGLMNTTNHFLDCVVDGAYTIELSECEFQKMLESVINRPDILPALLHAKNNLERITIMREIFPVDQFRKALVDVCKGFQKDADIAIKLEDRGRQFEVDMTYKKALRCYNLATLFAPAKTQNWARIYAFRSGLFHKMKEHENCLKDIKLALKNHCPDVLKHDLFRMVDVSSDALDNQDDTNELNPEIFEMHEYRADFIFKIDGKPNMKIPSAIDGLTIRKNEKKGRFVITDRTLPPGTTVILEKPYITTMDDAAKWETSHCSNCLAKTQRVVPCSRCVFVNYCSQRCKMDDYYGGHQYECPAYPFLHSMRMSLNNMLAFRAICKQGPNKLYELFLNTLLNEEPKPSPNFIDGFDPKTGKYDSNSYHQILHLKSHLSEDELPTLTWIAVAIITALEVQTNFFYESKKFDNQAFKNYVGSLYLQHAIAFPFNSVSLNDHVDIECNFMYVPGVPGGGIHFLESTEIGAGVFPITSLLCHSCDPNVFRENLPNGEVAIITNRELNPGDELQLSYGFGFIVQNLSERQHMTLSEYNFRCECNACVLKFPIYNAMNWTRKFLCPSCSDHFKDSQIIQSKLCCLINRPGPYDLTCPNCSEVSNMTKLDEEANAISYMVSEANGFILDRNAVPAVPLLVKAIPLYHAILCVPSKETIFAQLLLNEAYTMIANS